MNADNGFVEQRQIIDEHVMDNNFETFTSTFYAMSKMGRKCNCTENDCGHLKRKLVKFLGTKEGKSLVKDHNMIRMYYDATLKKTKPNYYE